MCNELSKESLKKNLIDIGCNHKQIQRFLKYYDDDDKKNMYFFLRLQRCRILEEVHREQKKIDYLDYLVYTLKNEVEI